MILAVPLRLSGLLFFPVTPFDAAGHHVDLGLLRAHVAERLEAGPGAVVLGGAAGELHTLSAAEAGAVYGTGIDAVGGRVPVLAGVGGPLGHAAECARAARDSGADALLLLPAYLARPGAEVALRYAAAVVAASDLPVILYHRGGAVFDREGLRELLADPRVIGVKDGVGDLALLRAARDSATELGRTDLVWLNGLPTAEVREPEYRRAGIPLYSSAVFAFAPGLALAYHRAAAADDDATCQLLLDEFFVPFERLRRSQPDGGLGVVKCAVTVEGSALGAVRPPLHVPDEATRDRVRRLVAHGESLVA